MLNSEPHLCSPVRQYHTCNQNFVYIKIYTVCIYQILTYHVRYLAYIVNKHFIRSITVARSNNVKSVVSTMTRSKLTSDKNLDQNAAHEL